jgi:hypothetical protein
MKRRNAKTTEIKKPRENDLIGWGTWNGEPSTEPMAVEDPKDMIQQARWLVRAAAWVRQERRRKKQKKEPA